MGKIKVVHIITKLELGGAQVNTIYTYEHLDPKRFQAFLVSGPGGILTGRLEKKDGYLEVFDLVREIHPLKDLKAFLAIRRFLKKINPQVIHTHSSKAGILGRLAAYSLGKKRRPVIIHSVHGFSFSPFQSFLKRSFFVLSEKLVAGITDHFVFVARDDVDTARQKRLVKDNYSLIRSGFPVQNFLSPGSEQKETRAQYNIPQSAFVCGVIAPFKPQKGLFHLVEVAALVAEKYPDILFFIAGDGALRTELEERLKEKGILDRFRLPGFLFDVHKAIDIFDIGVSTALWEGLPQSLVQLRLKKKAVVASNINGNREVIKHGENGFLLDLDDYPGFAQKIGFLYENAAERERLANLPEDFKEWDAAYMVERQQELYLKLL